jgi:hypothetical protein
MIIPPGVHYVFIIPFIYLVIQMIHYDELPGILIKVMAKHFILVVPLLS